MDRLESLSSTLSQITMYDIKSMYNQAKNVVLNVSEMEAKVREATNDEPWGASSTLQQEIAQGTFSFQYFNEIMPSIYARFMEKEARQWRQIYKALQLLEYLIKHGSERVVDDARSHISTIKMLRNFHYIDDKGKDEGLNVRNRSRELVELLSDVEKIRSERRKAKANKHKYVGTGNDGFGGGMSFSSGGSRYGGFGSDSLGGGGGGSYGGDREYGSYASGGGGGAGSSNGGFRDDTRRGGFEEYNAGNDEVVSSPTRSYSQSNAPRSPTRSATAPAAPKGREPAPVQEVDLLGGFGDEDVFGGSGTSTGGGVGGVGLATNKALPALGAAPASLDDDDFTEFQAAPVTAAPAASTTTTNTSAAKPNLMEMLNSTPMRAAPVASAPLFAQPAIQPQPAFGGMGMSGGMAGGYGHRQTSSQSFATSPQQQQNLFGGAPMKPTSPTAYNPSSRPLSTTLAPTGVNTNTTTNAKAGSNFDDLWSMSLGGGSAKPAGGAGLGTSQGKSIKDLEREKAIAGLWGGAGKPGVGAGSAGAGASAFGSFGGMGNSTSASSGGGDDLLL